jgi:hypothetical protein
VGTVAAAFAETGDFAEAVKYQQHALSLTGISPKERTGMQRRLELFEQNKPAHEPPTL